MDSKEQFENYFNSKFKVVEENVIEEAKQTEHQIYIEQRLEKFKGKVPKRYKNIKFDGEQRLLDVQRTVIYGPYGTGKTWMGYGIAKELYMAEKVSNFTIQREREIYNTLLAYKEKPDEYKKLYYDVDLLVIDEFGKNSVTDASSSHIFNIIDYRYDWQLRTILICNAEDITQLRKIVPLAVQDRFKGNIIFMGGESRRVEE